MKNLRLSRVTPVLVVLAAIHLPTGCTIPADDAGTGASSGEGGSTGSGSSVETVVHPIDGVQVTTLAGSDVAGSEDGKPGSFHNPVNLVLRPTGALLVADFDNNRLREVTSEGTTSTVTNQPNFARPFGLALAKSGALIVETDWNEDGVNGGTTAGAIWSIDLATGKPTAVLTNIGKARGLATLPDGRIVLSDIERNDIRLLDLGSKTLVDLAGQPGNPGFADGTGKDAKFNRPYGVVVTADGSILVADRNNNRIRKVALDGTVTTIAGHTDAAMVDGSLDEAYFDAPQDLAIDAAGNVYVSDVGNHRIRRISFANDAVETVAGDGTAGFADGGGTSAQFFGQEGIEVSPDGKTLFVADGTTGENEPYNRVRRVALP